MVKFNGFKRCFVIQNLIFTLYLEDAFKFKQYFLKGITLMVIIGMHIKVQTAQNNSGIDTIYS